MTLCEALLNVCVLLPESCAAPAPLLALESRLLRGDCHVLPLKRPGESRPMRPAGVVSLLDRGDERASGDAVLLPRVEKLPPSSDQDAPKLLPYCRGSSLRAEPWVLPVGVEGLLPDDPLPLHTEGDGALSCSLSMDTYTPLNVGCSAVAPPSPLDGVTSLLLGVNVRLSGEAPTWRRTLAA